MINVYFKYGAVSQFTRRFPRFCNVYVNIQSVSEGIVNNLGGGNMDCVFRVNKFFVVSL